MKTEMPINGICFSVAACTFPYKRGINLLMTKFFCNLFSTLFFMHLEATSLFDIENLRMRGRKKSKKKIKMEHEAKE